MHTYYIDTNVIIAAEDGNHEPSRRRLDEIERQVESRDSRVLMTWAVIDELIPRLRSSKASTERQLRRVVRLAGGNRVCRELGQLFMDSVVAAGKGRSAKIQLWPAIRDPYHARSLQWLAELSSGKFGRVDLHEVEKVVGNRLAQRRAFAENLKQGRVGVKSKGRTYPSMLADLMTEWMPSFYKKSLQARGVRADPAP